MSMTELHAGLEKCRERLQSVELLLSHSPRDGLVLARALIDDVRSLLDRDAPSVAAAQRWLEGAEAAGSVSADGIMTLRRLVTDVARAVGRTETTGFAAFRDALWHITGLQAAVGAAILVAAAPVALVMHDQSKRHAAEFDAAYSQGSAQLAAGEHAQAVELFRKAIDLQQDPQRAAGAWNNMGWCLQQLGHLDEAIAAYRKALALQPTFQLARNNLEAAQRKLDLTKGEAEPAHQR